MRAFKDYKKDLPQATGVARLTGKPD